MIIGYLVNWFGVKVKFYYVELLWFCLCKYVWIVFKGNGIYVK